MNVSKLTAIIIAIAFIIGLLAFSASFYGRLSEDREREALMTVGRDLAGQYCAACHLEPPPDILPKRSWEAALGYMGYWLGITDLGFLDDHPEFVQANVSSRHEALVRENAFPASPALDEADWEALRYYYVESAPEQELPQENKPQLSWQLPQFEALETDYPLPQAITTLVRIRPETQQIFLGDSGIGTLTILDADGSIIAPPTRAPRAITPVDIEFVGETAYIGSIGDLIASEPSTERLAHIASVELTEASLGEAEFSVVVDDIYRMADMNVLDLNGDGALDFVVSGFGAVRGNVAWWESQADGSYQERVLVALPGAVKTEPYDFNGDGLLDIMVLLSDAREGLHILENQGGNVFEMRTVFVSHPGYGHTYFELQDFNADGMMDVLVVNGDNVDSDPYNTKKNYHGIRIYLNRGDYEFDEAYFYPMYGAFIAKAADFDEDGDLDIAAISFYPDFSSGTRESFSYLQNEGNLDFRPFTNGQVMRGRWMTMDVNDVDGDSDIDVVLGGGYIPTGMFAYMDLFEDMTRDAPPIMILKNVLR